MAYCSCPWGCGLRWFSSFRASLGRVGSTPRSDLVFGRFSFPYRRQTAYLVHMGSQTAGENPVSAELCHSLCLMSIVWVVKLGVFWVVTLLPKGFTLPLWHSSKLFICEGLPAVGSVVSRLGRFSPTYSPDLYTSVFLRCLLRLSLGSRLGWCSSTYSSDKSQLRVGALLVKVETVGSQRIPFLGGRHLS